MDTGWAALLTAALAMHLLRGVVLALISPGPWPIIARLTGAAMALGVFLLCGRRLLPGLALGLAASWAVDTALR